MADNATTLNQQQQKLQNLYSQQLTSTQNAYSNALGNVQAYQVQAPQQIQYQAVAAPNQLNASLVPNPGNLQAAQVGNVGTLNASLVSAPTISSKAPAYENIDKINAGTISADMQSYEDLAKQISAYLRPYTDSAINARRQQTAQNRASIDVDAASRGMGSSTWVTDAKLRQAQAEAADITNLENQFTSNLMQQVYQSDQAQRERAQQAAIQNVGNQLSADLAYQSLMGNRASALFNYGADVNLTNANYAYDASKTNAGNTMTAGQFNIGNQLTRGTTNAELAQQAALALFNAQNDINAANAGYRNQFAMYNNDNAYNAAIAERAYRDALASQAREWQYDADVFNAQMAYNAAMNGLDYQSQLDQLAWNRAMQLAQMSGVGGGGGGDNSGITAAPAGTADTGTGNNSNWFFNLVQEAANKVKGNTNNSTSTTTTKKTGQGGR